MGISVDPSCGSGGSSCRSRRLRKTAVRPTARANIRWYIESLAKVVGQRLPSENVRMTGATQDSSIPGIGFTGKKCKSRKNGEQERRDI